LKKVDASVVTENLGSFCMNLHIRFKGL
jgi:hypothetical protein